MTQDARILQHLEHKPITSLEAFKSYGITRLSAVIWRLRHEQGYDIRKTNITVENRFGHTTSVAQYYMIKENESER